MILAALLALWPSADRVDDAPSVIEASRDETHTTLERLRGAWTPHSIGLILGEALPHAARFEPALAEILLLPRHPLFRAALRMAVYQRQVGLVPTIRATMRRADDPLKALIIRETDALVPWTDDELEVLLESESLAVVIAALRVAGSRSPPRMDEIIPRLVDPVPDVRAAALAAVPDALDVAIGQQIVEAQRFLPDALAREALIALARCPPGSATDLVLYGQLEAGPDRQDAALDGLAFRGSPLLHPARIHRVIADETLPWSTRARAVRCLEMTGTLTGAEALEDIWPSHPVIEYFAARVLIRAGRVSGVHKLLKTLEPTHVVGDDNEEILAQLRLSARQLVAALSGTGIYSGQSEWAEWAGRLQQVTPTSLPDPVISLP